MHGTHCRLPLSLLPLSFNPLFVCIMFCLMFVNHTQLPKPNIIEQAFPVSTVHVCNGLPQHVTSAPSLPIFRSRLRTHLSRRCTHHSICCTREVSHVISDTLIVDVNANISFFRTALTR